MKATATVSGGSIPDLTFTNEGGILRYTVKGSKTIKSINVKSTSPTLDVTLDCGTSGVALTAEGTVFNIALPAGTYSDATLTFTATDNTLATKAASSFAVTKNVVSLATFESSALSFIAPPTTGTAKATIGGSEVDVNWVQLWAGGPKFAEYNVGASSATGAGSKKTYTEATKADAEYVWGSNWCTPSKDQMNELLLAAKGNNSTKVTCDYCEYTTGDGKWGFKFTGKKTGYTGNSVFFPAEEGDSDSGEAKYWSATADDEDDDCALFMYLYYDDGDLDSDWDSNVQDGKCLVRPVFKN